MKLLHIFKWERERTDLLVDKTVYCSKFALLYQEINPIRPGLFSRSPGPGEGGVRGDMPKIKVTIN